MKNKFIQCNIVYIQKTEALKVQNVFVASW